MFNVGPSMSLLIILIHYFILLNIWSIFIISVSISSHLNFVRQVRNSLLTEATIAPILRQYSSKYSTKCPVCYEASLIWLLWIVFSHMWPLKIFAPAAFWWFYSGLGYFPHTIVLICIELKNWGDPSIDLKSRNFSSWILPCEFWLPWLSETQKFVFLLKGLTGLFGFSFLVAM